jgi:hypothetical protein
MTRCGNGVGVAWAIGVLVPGKGGNVPSPNSDFCPHAVKISAENKIIIITIVGLEVMVFTVLCLPSTSKLENFPQESF